jgi:hypothetical protein
MTDDLVKQSIAELQDIVRCRCHPAYTGRGMHDPDCECDSADAVQVVADRIEELEGGLHKMALEYLDAASKSYQAQLKAEAKLAKAVEALMDIVKDCEAEYPPSHGAIKYFCRTTLAELKGEDRG